MKPALAMIPILLASIFLATEISEGFIKNFLDPEWDVYSVLISEKNHSNINQSKIVSCNDVIAKINANRPLDFDDCTIVGDLNLSTMNITVPIHFNRTIFQDLVNCKYTIFSEPANFYYSSFNGPAIFEGSNFREPARFRSSNFNEYANFSSSNFSEYANFYYSNFSGPAIFFGSNFTKYANFEKSNFSGDVYFAYSIFGERANFIFCFFNRSSYPDTDEDYEDWFWIHYNPDFYHCNFSGPAYFDNSEFNGPTNFMDSNFSDAFFESTNFSTRASFSFSKFNKSAVFYSSYFNGTADFDNIKGDADFRYSHFNGNANFNSSIFEGTLFWGSNFMDAYFVNSTFKRAANFGGTDFYGDQVHPNFNGKAEFSNSKFSEDALFESCNFNGSTNFTSSHFSKTALFKDTDFNGTTYFNRSNFNGSANFMSSNFNGIACFLESVFDKKANFNDAQFNEPADFSFSQFREAPSFVGATFNDKLALTRTSYDKLYIRWISIKKGLLYDDSAYLGLIKNFKDLGYFEDSDNCYFQYRKDRRSQPWPCTYPLEESARKFIDFLSEWSYGYGTRPANPFLGSLLLIGLFGIAWRSLCFDKNRKSDANNAPIDEYYFTTIVQPKRSNDNLNWPKLQSFLSLLEPFGFSAVVFLSGARILIDPPRLPEMPEKSKQFGKNMFDLERMLGSIFIGLLLLSISRTIIRAT
jgi:hypothetical protein